jgi:hypothetical protein
MYAPLTDHLSLAHSLVFYYRQTRIREPNAATRATVVSAIRYTFADTSQSYDELLAPLLVDFLSLMLDEDLVSDAISQYYKQRH